MAAATLAPEFLNRNREREHLDALLADVRADHSGEWLRRERRRVDARAQLRAAHDQFTSMGMDAFAERARTELSATGESARKRTVETRDELTSQERQIAQLARDGLSNPEIGARLFLSPRTIEWHLRKVFTKLEIHSRHELSNALRLLASPSPHAVWRPERSLMSSPSAQEGPGSALPGGAEDHATPVRRTRECDAGRRARARRDARLRIT